VLLGGAPWPARAADEPPPIGCRPGVKQDIPLAAGRSRYCVIDVGSRNVKLIVASLRADDPSSLEDERSCRARLYLGQKTFDEATQKRLPLPDHDLEALARVIRDYRDLCTHDGGKLAGAAATEWARRATNGEAIRRELRQRAGIDLAILKTEEEARYGYVAATRGARGKLVVDFGSRSLQLSYWADGARAPATVGLPLGIDEAGARFFGDPAHHDYASARAAFVQAIQNGARALLATVHRRSPKAAAPEIFSLGENGDVPLALAGKLWEPSSRKPVTEDQYKAAVEARTPEKDRRYGPVAGVIDAPDITALAETFAHDQALFEQLRSDPAKRFVGYKMLAFAALLSMLANEVGAQKVVLVPQEMSDGLMLEKVAAGAAAAEKSPRPRARP